MSLRSRAGVLLGACLVLAATTAGALSVKDICDVYPNEVRALFDQLDATQPEMAACIELSQNDLQAASARLLDYYRQHMPGVSPRSDDQADTAAAVAVLEDTYTFYDVTATVPRLPHGGLDWTFTGPAKDREWAWALNRFSHFNLLLDAYAATGDARYAKRINFEIEDWATQSPYPGERNDTPQWRGLETALRIQPWSRAFTQLQQEPAFSDGARLLMLTTLPSHADYLRRFHGDGNWLTMEMNGLAGIGVTWSEFQDSEAWVSEAETRILADLKVQIYPDGAQKELTSMYHYVVVKNFEAFADRLREAGRAPAPELQQALEQLWNYLAYTMRPDGHGLLNNDSDLKDNRALVMDAASRYERPDWGWIATNGSTGAAPEAGPTVFFPWAGQAVFRSGWNADALWSFFDLGPLGTKHEHYDKLHLSISAFGRDLLVDSGRYTYVGGTERSYYRSTAAHNTITFAGKGQKPAAKESKAGVQAQFERGEGYVYAFGEHMDGYNDLRALAEHSRAVVLLDAGFWIVVDKVFSDRDQKIAVNWHYHPRCEVGLEGNQVFTSGDAKGHLRIIPAGPVSWNPAIVKGAAPPDMQGWYSESYSLQEPAPCAVYEGKIGAEYTWFAWVLLPGQTSAPKAEVSWSTPLENTMSLEIMLPGKAPIRVDIDTVLASKRPRVRLLK
ncbi:MAG: hypothetical protein GC168_01455 [Candidatus Hydrogenedens sp.]|nr:hypothetical protein [Candidatus Hydrogenedens sp.]